MSEIVLLGAGASVEAGIPDSYEMTKRIAENINTTQHERYAHALYFVIGGLMLQKGVEGSNPYEGVNVEELFNAIQMLDNRYILEAAPFVASWHPMVEELDKRKNWNTWELERDLERLLTFDSPSWAPSRIAKSIVKLMEDFTTPGQGTTFMELSVLVERCLISLVHIKQPERVAYLSPLLSLLKQQGDLVVGTLNYDNAVEILANSAGVSCETGIDHWSQTGSFKKDYSGLLLLKLHGSIDWKSESGKQDEAKPMPHAVIKKVTPENIQKGYRPAIRFGNLNKLTTEGPFLDILRSFQEQLAKAELLTIVGYSFRDPHINEYITQWINGRTQRKLRIIDPGFSENLTIYVQKLRQYCKRITIIPQKASEGLAVAFSQ